MYDMGVASARQVTAARRVLMQWITCPVVHFELMLCTRYPMSSSMIDCENSQPYTLAHWWSLRATMEAYHAVHLVKCSDAV